MHVSLILFHVFILLATWYQFSPAFFISRYHRCYGLPMLLPLLNQQRIQTRYFLWHLSVIPSIYRWIFGFATISCYWENAFQVIRWPIVLLTVALNIWLPHCYIWTVRCIGVPSSWYHRLCLLLTSILFKTSLISLTKIKMVALSCLISTKGIWPNYLMIKYSAPNVSFEWVLIPAFDNKSCFIYPKNFTGRMKIIFSSS